MRWARTLTFAAPVLAALIGGCTAVPYYGSTPSARTYYVSAQGDDSARGTSPDAAWRTLARAEQVTLRPGDRLLLEGGARFTGTIMVGGNEAGDPKRPVVVGSYGSGRATVVAKDSPGVSVHNTGGVAIHDLVLKGRGAARTGQAGVNLYNDAAAAGRRHHVTVSDIDASGFQVGLGVGSTVVGNGFADVVIRRADLHDNKDAGLLTYGPKLDPARPAYAHEDIDIEGVHAYDNAGDPTVTRRSTGNGIAVSGVRHAVVRNSSAHDNGSRAAAKAIYGPVGVWTYDSTGVLIEHNTAYRNHTGSRVDGAGFGLDMSVSHSTVQYNLSFQNDGSGYYVWSRAHHPHTDNTIRYNISDSDGRKLPHHGALMVNGFHIRDLKIYQNTLVMPRSPAGDGTAVRVRPRYSSGVTIRNNILVTDGEPLVLADRAFSPGQVLFQGNQFHTVKGRWRAWWGEHEYRAFQAWREGTGQERTGARATGTTTSPCFEGGPLPRIGSSSDARRMIPGCPQDGLDLRTLFGVAPGSVDYFGHAVTSPPNTGAAQP